MAKLKWQICNRSKIRIFLKKAHSLECNMSERKEKDIIKLEKQINQDKNNFIAKCEAVMNNSSIYYRRLFKETFKKIYNEKNNNYNFIINNNFLSNIITKWRNNNIRFKKENFLYDRKDRDKRLILREFRSIPIEGSNRGKQIKHE